MAEQAAMQTRGFTGSVYEGDPVTDSGWPPPRYRIVVVTEKGPGTDRLRLESIDDKGNRFFLQTIDFDGDCPTSYVFSNSALQQAGRLTVTPQELVMEFTENGRTRTAREPRPVLFEVGPSVGRLVERHLGELVAGKTISFRMVVVNRLESIAFRIFRAEGPSSDPLPQVRSGDWFRLRAEPDNAILRMFAPKVSIIAEARTGETVLVSGPLPSPDAPGGLMKNGTIRYSTREGEPQ